MHALLLRLFIINLIFIALNFKCKSEPVANQKYFKVLMPSLKFGLHYAHLFKITYSEELNQYFVLISTADFHLTQIFSKN
jgi:hypothetical protein